ncbi:unnamed protein product [Choristocarpus tenellus]
MDDVQAPKKVQFDDSASQVLVQQNVQLPNIIFVKPHKVGSSSMSNLVRLIAARNGGVASEYQRKTKCRDMFAKKMMQPIIPQLHIWADHCKCSKLLEDVERDIVKQAFTFTLVRDPVDRCLSGYYYYFETNNPHIVLSEQGRTHNKLKYGPCGNHGSQMKEIRPTKNATVAETVDFYDLVGITGRFMESLTVMKMFLGLSYGDMLFFDDKRSGNGHLAPRLPMSSEPPEVLEHFKNLNDPMDEELFRLASKKLDMIIRKLQPEFSVVNETLTRTLREARNTCGDTSRSDKIDGAFGCFGRGNCRISCLRNFAAEAGLLERPPTVNITV